MKTPLPTETIADVRSHLFATLRGLTDTTNPMDIERARAVSDVAQTIINSAKVECEHLKIVGGKGSGFIPELTSSPSLPPGVIHQEPGLTVKRNWLEG